VTPGKDVLTGVGTAYEQLCDLIGGDWCRARAYTGL
jgi:hypothetical protein